MRYAVTKHPMSSLANILSDVFQIIFEKQGMPHEHGKVRVSDRPDLAQFQCNGAMACAKSARKNPREIAQNIIDALLSSEHKDLFTKLEIAGPGFINIDINDQIIGSHLTDLNEKLGAESLGDNQTIILDYGGPNIAKPMHVGHLRASIIGDSLRRICGFVGYKAIGDVHMGDWGTPMGMIISALEEQGRLGDPITLEDLEDIYPKAAQACKEDNERMEKAKKATLMLQEGHEPYKAAWQNFIDVSIAGMKENFDSLGVYFDLWEGEAAVHHLIAPMVESLKTKGLAIESDGALIVEVAKEQDNKEIPPLILYKSDGAVMYSTTDLATLVERENKWQPNEIIYVVDQRQSLHFEQVFRAAKTSEITAEDTKLVHAGFGTMNGPDGKPFKTREGGVMKLEDLISMGQSKALQRLEEADLAQDMNAKERAGVAHKVSIAAIKFADLHNNRIADYIFDLDRLTSFEGKTGPYLLYQAVRIKSLLAKAQKQGYELPSDIKGLEYNIQEEDRELALIIAQFPDHIMNAWKNYTPHILCDYVFALAQSFSSFYAACHILSEENADIRNSRLNLCFVSLKHIEQVLDLLGIEIPERM